MKRPVALLALLFACATAAFLIFSFNKEAPVFEEKQTVEDLCTKRGPEKGISDNHDRSHPDAEDLAQLEELAKAFQVAQRQTFEAFAKAGASMTPELEAQHLERVMHRRQGDYAKLFERWDLPTNAVKQVMDIVRERERVIISARTNFFKKGAAGLMDYKQALQIEGLVSKVQFDFLLGEARAHELISLESQVREREVGHVPSGRLDTDSAPPEGPR